MVSYAEILTNRGQGKFSEPEVQEILEAVLMQLAPLHRRGKAHQQISLETLEQEGGQTFLFLKDNSYPGGSLSQDIYDLGLVALELLTGQVPSPRRTNPAWDWNEYCLISDQLNVILERMVTPNPAQRWQNADEVLSGMRVVIPDVRIIPESPQLPQAPPMRVTTTVKRSPRSLKGWPFGLLGAGTTLIVAVGGLSISSPFIPALRPLLPSAMWSWQIEPRSSGQIEQGSAVMFQGNLERTGVYPPGGPTQLNQLRWKFKTEGEISSSPAVSEGVVYFGSLDNYLYAVDTNTGQELWKFRTGDGVYSSPAVSERVVYFGSYDGYMYAVDVHTGQELWKFKTESRIFSSSPAVSGGVVYFGSLDNYLYAVNANTGQELWKFRTEDEIRSSPAVSGGVVYFGSLDNYLYAVNANTGQELWKFKTEGRIFSSSAVLGGVVYFGSEFGRDGNYLYAVDASTGQELWKFKTEDGIRSSPAVSGGIIYFGSLDNYLYAVDTNTGQELWKFKTEDVISSSPAVSGGIIYFGSLDNYLYAVDTNTGQELWKFKTEGGIGIGSAPAVLGGVVYFGSHDGYMYAVK